MVSKEEILEALRECYDPEIPVNIVDLGLIYDVRIEGEEVFVDMTLTAPGCPMHSLIAREVKSWLEKLSGVKNAHIRVIWDPPWTPDRMTAKAKSLLGIS